MPKKSVAKTVPPVAVDPTIETSDVVIEGKVYRMCLNTRALAQAERELVAKGHDVMLLRCFPLKLNLESILMLFAASIRKFHPEIGFEEAVDLVTPPYIANVAVALVQAYNNSRAKPVKGEKNPTEPGSQTQS